MAIDDDIWNQKLQYNINRKAVQIPTLSSRKIDKYEYLTGADATLYTTFWSKNYWLLSYLLSFMKSFRKRNNNDGNSRKKQ